MALELDSKLNMETLSSGVGHLFQAPDADRHRAYIREHKRRAPVDKVITEQEAAS